VPDYDELVLVANEDELAEHKQDLRLFVGALARGAQQARRDPSGAAQALLDASKDLKPKLTRASVRATLPALFPKGDEPWGYMDPRQWRVYGAWMFGHDLLSERPDTPAAFTNELLPGEGL
jgi:putative hydroxymethylpyrimidine transport system substrate-binding protein